MRFPRRWNKGTRRPISKSRICCETLGCEIPSRSAARLKLPASATARKYRRWRMSNGSDMEEGILFGVDAECNQELDPNAFGLDCEQGICLHRQNLLRHLKNLLKARK